MECFINDAFWERANLHIVTNCKITSAYIVCGNLKYILKHGENHVLLPIYNTPENTHLPSGNWTFYVNDKILRTDEFDVLSLSKDFEYSKNNVYSVNFVSNSNKNLEINTFFCKKIQKNGNIKSKKVSDIYVIKGNYNFFIKMCIFMLQLLYNFFSLFAKDTRVLFLSEYDDELSTNLYLVKKKIDTMNEYETRTYLKNMSKNKMSILKRIPEVYLLATSKYIILDNYCTILSKLNIKDNVKIVQLWHAAVGFKAVGYARYGKKGSPHPYNSAHRKYTHVFVDNELLKPVYSEVFGISDDNIYSYGIPRLDTFLDKKYIKKEKETLYRKYPIISEKKVVLYAPTFRGSDQSDAYFNIDVLPLKKIDKYCGDNDIIFIIKMHPFVSTKKWNLNEYENIIDLSDYKDINKLLYISDLLITDYSSCAYEASLLNLPIIFYRYDKDEYEKGRGVHTANVFFVPNIEVHNEDELLRNITKMLSMKKNSVSYVKKNSTDKIIKEIFR